MQKGRYGSMKLKRIHRIYIIMGLFLIFELAGLFFNSGVVAGINSRADKLKVYATAQRDDATILPGDIFDRNGNVIVENGYTVNGDRYSSYIDGKAYSQIVGYTGSRILNPLADSADDVIGGRNAYRLMAFLDEDVWGKNGLYSTTNIDGTKGQSATLTIDHDLQMAVYNILCNEMSDSEDIGSAVVMDAKTGEILSMVSFPAYDFNDLDGAIEKMQEDESRPYFDPGFPVSYKNSEVPGSIFKVLTSVAMIDHEMENYTIENVDFTVDGYTCAATWTQEYPELDMESALAVSSNVYFAKAACELGADAFRETAEKFMLIEGNNDLSSDFGNIRYNWNLDVSENVLAQTGFGQGETEFSTVYAAMITQAIANDGKMMQPFMIQKLTDADGKVVYKGKSEMLSQATSKSTARQVAKNMRLAAQTACEVHEMWDVLETFDRYEVAGKTGTGENGDEDVTDNAWFISFAPANDPQYVVVVNQCRNHKFGFQMMPSVASIYEYLFESYGNQTE